MVFLWPLIEYKNCSNLISAAVDRLELVIVVEFCNKMEGVKVFLVALMVSLSTLSTIAEGKGVLAADYS